MKQETIDQVFSYLNISNSHLYKPSNYNGQKNFICKIENNYWFLMIFFNMYCLVKENPELQTREEFKFNSSDQLKVAISKDQDIKKVFAFIVSQLNYIVFLKTNYSRKENTNLGEVYTSINNHYISNTYLHPNLIEEKTVTFDIDSVIFAPLQSSRMTIRPELRQSNYLNREQIEELISNRVSDSISQLAEQTQRIITPRERDVENIRSQLMRLSEQIRILERNNNE